MGEGDFGVVEIGRARCGAGTVDPAGSLRWMGPSRRVFKRTNRERDMAIPHWWVGSGGGGSICHIRSLAGLRGGGDTMNHVSFTT